MITKKISTRLPGTIFLITCLIRPIYTCAQSPDPKRVEIGEGIELHYIERGAGEPIIFIHGLTDDYTVWTKQVEAFAKDNFRAIAYSRRHNFPNQNQLTDDHSARVEAEDLADLIETLKLGPTHLIGHSYGAYTALMLTLQRPELVRTVTLAEPPIVPWLKDLRGDSRETARAQLTKLLNEGILPTKKAFAEGKDEQAIRTMFNCIAGQALYDRLPPFVKAKCMRNRQELKALVQSDNRYPPVNRQQIAELGMPTLVMSGANSLATSRFTDPELERLLPAATSKRLVIPDTTHIMWIEKPVQCRQAVQGFIREYGNN